MSSTSGRLTPRGTGPSDQAPAHLTWFVPGETLPLGASAALVPATAPRAGVARDAAPKMETTGLATDTSQWVMKEVFGNNREAASRGNALAQRIGEIKNADEVERFKRVYQWVVDGLFASDRGAGPQAAEVALDIVAHFDAVAFDRLVRIDEWAFGQLFRLSRTRRREAFDLARDLLAGNDEATVERLKQLCVKAIRDGGLPVEKALAWARGQAGL